MDKKPWVARDSSVDTQKSLNYTSEFCRTTSRNK